MLLTTSAITIVAVALFVGSVSVAGSVDRHGHAAATAVRCR